MPVPVKAVCVSLTQEDVERARTLGDNNVSRGIRAALAYAWKRRKPR